MSSSATDALPPKKPLQSSVPFSYASALASSHSPATAPALSANANSPSISKPSDNPASVALPLRVPLVDHSANIPPPTVSAFAPPTSPDSPVSPQVNPNSPPSSARSQSPSSRATAATPNNWTAGRQLKLADNSADFSSDAKSLSVGPPGLTASSFLQPQIHQDLNWSSVASPPRRQSLSFPQTPVHDYRIALSEQLANMGLSNGNAGTPQIETAVFDDDDELVLSRKRNVRLRTASTPNAMMGIPPSNSAFLENYSPGPSNSSWGGGAGGGGGAVSTNNTWTNEPGKNSSIWNGGNNDSLSVGTPAKQYRSLSFSLESQSSPMQAGLERRSSFVQEDPMFQQHQQSRPRTPLLSVPGDHIQLQNDSEFGFANGRARSKSSSATTAYPPASQYLSTSPNNPSTLDPLNSIWSNNDSNNVNAILHRRASTQPSVIEPRWGGGGGGGGGGAATDSLNMREPLRNDDDGFLSIGGLDSDRYRRRHSHAPNLYAELAAQMVARPSNEADIYDARRRHSLGGPPLYANYLNDLEASYNTKTDPVQIFEEINDYFENTEHRTKAWVEAGKNLQKQTTFASQQQQLASSTQQFMSHSYWPVYVVEFKAGRIDYFHAADATYQGIRKGDLVIVEADRGKDLGKVIHDGLANLAQLQLFQSQHKDIMVESLISGKEIHPKRIYSLAQANEIALLVSKAQDEAKAVAVCQAKIRQRKLPMEIVDAEYQWDRKKLTFYFVADRRVDFRELIRVFQSPGRESQASPPLQPLVHHHAAKKAVVFVVHGMGSQLEGYGKFVQNLAQLRKTCADVLTEEFSASPHAVGVSGEDIAFIPIEWHSLVHGLDSVDSRMNLVTLPTTPIFRQINNDMLADVLYFFSAFHGSKILKIVANVLNTEHQKFMAENPDFSGKICILAHSLGGVISYDLLANQDIATEIFDEKTDTLGKSGDGQAERVRCRTHYEICYPKLNFEPKHVNFLVTIGSQIGPVMIMRGQSPQTYSLPAHIVHRNVFHLYDPMAYRLEPLIDVRYADIAPQPIQRPSATSSLTASATLAFTRVYYQALAAVLGTYTGFTSLAMGGASTSIVEGAQATVAEAAVAAAASSSSAGGASLLGAGPGFLSRAIMPDFEALAARVSAGGVSVAGIVTGGAGAVGAVVPDTFSRAGRVVVEGMVGLTRGLFFEPAAAAADDDTHAAPPDTAPAKRSRARDLRDVGDVAGEEGDGRGRKRRRVNAGQSVTMADDDGQRKIAEPRRSRRSRVRKQPAAHEAGVAASDAVHADAQDAAPNAACPTSPPTVVDGVLDTIRSAVRRVSNALMVFDAESEEAKTEADLLDALSPADSGESQEPATLRSLKRVGRNDSQQVEEVLTEELAAAAERALNRPNDARDKDFAVESRLPSESSSVADDSSGEKPLPLKERLDYFVTETVMDSSVHQYFIGMKAHFSYWTNKDMMYFIVDDLLKDSSPQTETK